MKHALLVFAIAAVLLAQSEKDSGAAVPERRLPPLAPGAQIVTLTPEPGFHNEPSIAINPRDPQQLAIAWQTNATVAYSRDAGEHWHVAHGTAPLDYRVSGDVSITYDAQGHAILCYIAFDKLGTASYWGHNATRNGIYVRRSLDGGVTWESEPVKVTAHASEPGIPFEDKPYIVADNSNSRFRRNLYAGWTQFSLTQSLILFSRSTDGGRSWSKPRRISTHAGLPRDDNGSAEGFTGAVDRAGTLYTVWADGNNIAFTYSRDGGRTFARSRAIIRTAPPYFQLEDVSRANGFPQIAWAKCPKSAPACAGAGMLYVTWSDYRNGDVDVFCSISKDGGRRWSKPVRVNTDSVHNGADQFFQWLAVDPVDGSAYVLFYDRRADPENKKAIVVLARSTDGGRTWINCAFSEQPFSADNDFLGDYTGLAVLNGQVYGAWAEEVASDRTPPAGTWNAEPAERGTTPNREAGQTVSGKPQHRTVLRIGHADFSGRQP
jgi:hypothetical protein